jgi:hypothetical protein
MSFAYGVLLTLMVVQHLRSQGERKLRAEHYAAMEALRGEQDATRHALQGRPHILTWSPGSPYSEVYNSVALMETLKMLQQEKGITSRRLDQLERQIKSTAA